MTAISSKRTPVIIATIRSDLAMVGLHRPVHITDQGAVFGSFQPGTTRFGAPGAARLVDEAWFDGGWLAQSRFVTREGRSHFVCFIRVGGAFLIWTLTDAAEWPVELPVAA